MNWFSWRQHRKQFLIMGVILVIYAAITITAGMHFWHTYQSTLASCRQNPANPTCSDLQGNLFQSNLDQSLLHLVPIVVMFLPLVLGVFWGVPLLAREYTDGTNSLAWTQSVSRRKWLSVKLLWMLIAAVLFIAAFSALNTYFSRTLNSLNMDRFGNDVSFRTQNIVPVAIGVFLAAYGIMFGAWFRKTMVAIGVTLGLFVVVSSIVLPNLLRPHYMTPVTVTEPFGPPISGSDSKIPQDAWVVSQTITNGSGHAIYGDIFPVAPLQCQKIIQQQQVSTPGGGIRIKAKTDGSDPVSTCLNKAGWHQIAKYQPSYRYWDFQRIETGIYLGLSALAIGATYWLVLKRDA